MSAKEADNNTTNDVDMNADVVNMHTNAVEINTRCEGTKSGVVVRKVDEYTPEVAERVRELLRQLSRSGKDRGEVPKEWFEEVISSDYHDLLLAYDDEKIVGMASLSVVMGAGIGRNAFLEDFVVEAEARGKGVGSAIWAAMLRWAREKGCANLEFTSGAGREAAQRFYRARGAEIYETNFFRKIL